MGQIVTNLHYSVLERGTILLNAGPSKSHLIFQRVGRETSKEVELICLLRPLKPKKKEFVFWHPKKKMLAVPYYGSPEQIETFYFLRTF